MLKEQLDFSFVDIVSIHSSIPRAQFSSEKIEDLAKSFLETGGTVKPLIVKMVDMDDYEVISGHLEYYAALRARELNDNFELIRVIIAPSQKREKIEAQLKLLENDLESTQTVRISSNNLSQENELLNVLKNQDDNIRKQLDSFGLIVKDLVKQNQNSQKKIELFAQDAFKENLSFLDRFNLLEESDLRPCLEIALDGARTEKALRSILKERQNKKFESLEDIFTRVKITHGNKQQKAFGDKTILKLFERWSSVIFKQAIIAPSQKPEKIEAQLKLLENDLEPAQTVRTSSNKSNNISQESELLNVLKNQDDNIRRELDHFGLIVKDLIKQHQSSQKKIELFAQDAFKENLSFLNRFNLLEESDLRPCLQAALDEARTEKALRSILRERENKKFKSLEDVFTRVKITHGNKQQKVFGDKTILKLFEKWSSVSFKHLVSRNHQ